MSSPYDEEPQEPIVRDRRRFDPTTGEVREPGPGAAAPGPAGPDPLAGLEAEAGLLAQLDERTADLQRVQAEFTNYRRRVERDRQAEADRVLARVLAELLPVLDDIDRARTHGHVDGAAKLLADGLEAALGKLGLERFGAAGDPFDPTLHEALTHGLSADVEEPTCGEVFQPGYRIGGVMLRPARVAVLEPADAGDPSTPGEPA